MQKDATFDKTNRNDAVCYTQTGEIQRVAKSPAQERHENLDTLVIKFFELEFIGIQTEKSIKTEHDGANKILKNTIRFSGEF